MLYYGFMPADLDVDPLGITSFENCAHDTAFVRRTLEDVQQDLLHLQTTLDADATLVRAT